MGQQYNAMFNYMYVLYMFHSNLISKHLCSLRVKSTAARRSCSRTATCTSRQSSWRRSSASWGSLFSPSTSTTPSSDSRWARHTSQFRHLTAEFGNDDSFRTFRETTGCPTWRRLWAGCRSSTMRCSSTSRSSYHWWVSYHSSVRDEFCLVHRE